ncbi:hypothetical protein MNV49_006938 [Pseudohyphozyma bogoriensis]|nr:hypothetical protein MNV49_006938 [Pseudohyphozyma bogoriensis]
MSTEADLVSTLTDLKLDASKPESTEGTRKWRVTVLISGSGSNLQALLDALPTTLSSSLIVSVLSNKAKVRGLERAASHSPPIPNYAFSRPTFKKSLPADSPLLSDEPALRAAWELEFVNKVKATRPDLVVLAGWMVIIHEPALSQLVRDWEEGQEWDVEESVGGSRTPGASPYPSKLAKGTPIPIINLHPALPGTFPGAHAIDDAYKAFNDPPEGVDKIDRTGIMIHRVIPELDAGEPVVVKEIMMIEGESQDDLETRIHAVEHRAIVEAVEKVTTMLGDGTWWK